MNQEVVDLVGEDELLERDTFLAQGLREIHALAEGDVAKASRSLGIPEDTLRAVVRRWEDKGKEYRNMADLVRWRKRVGRRETLPLNEAILHDRTETVDYPGLLSDVLDGLLSMNEENWDDRCQELAELLRPAVHQSGT